MNWKTKPKRLYERFLVAAVFYLSANLALGDHVTTSITHIPATEQMQIVSPAISPQKKENIKSRLNLSVTRLANKSIRAISPSSKVIKLTVDNVNSAIQPNTLIFERMGVKANSTNKSGTKIWQLPLRVSYIRSDGSVFSFRPDVRVLQPLKFIHGDNIFKGELGFEVIDESNPQSRETLRTPVAFALASTMDKMDPQQFSITHLNQPFKVIKLEARNPGKDVSVDVITTALEESDRIAVPAIRPRLTVSLSPSDGINGFGLSTAVVHVSAVDGGVFKGIPVFLRRSTGSLKDNQVTLDSSGTAETILRSSFVGKSQVTATGYPFAEGSDTIIFVWPILFSIVALIGAVLGAWVSHRQRNASFSLSLIYGLVGGILGALGVNFLNLPVVIPVGEAFIFIVTFFAAYLGSAAFKGSIPGMSGQHNN